MRFRTLCAILALLFALPALAQDKRPTPLPVAPPTPQSLVSESTNAPPAPQKPEPANLIYEVRLVRAPASALEQAGVKTGRDTALTAGQLRAVLDLVQSDRDTNVMLFPKITANDGERATATVGDTRMFATSLEATKVNGLSVCVPKQTPVHLGETVTVKGVLSADRSYARVEATVTHARLVGSVELVPVVTQVTPIFEGGAQGTPVPVKQFLQVPDIRKGHVERSALVPTGETLLVGSWKEVAEPQVKGKPGQELEVVVLVTVRADTQKQPLAPPAARFNTVHKLRNVAAADAVRVLAEHFKGSGAVVVAEPVSNALLVNADKDTSARFAELVAVLDREPRQIAIQALVLEVPYGFADRAGIAGKPGATAWALSPRETQMLNAILRSAKEQGGCEVLSRPQLLVADNQTGYVNVGHDNPVQTANRKFEHKSVGVTLRITPRVEPDGKAVALATEVQHVTAEMRPMVSNAQVPGAFLPVTALEAVPVLNTREVRSQTVVPVGHTLVLAGAQAHSERSLTGAVRHLCGAHRQTLVILTPELVAPTASVTPTAGWFTK